MAKEYIDREAAIAQCRRHSDYTAWSIESGIEATPAADVAEVVHGRWLNFVNDYSTAECDKCGEIYEVSDYHDEKHFNAFKRFYNYCPNCGAKMDGGEENAAD